MIISVVYLLLRCLLGCLMVLTRHQVSKDAELLVLRHENAVLRRQISRVPTWGHRWVQGEPVRLGHSIAASTVWQRPTPRRTGPTWKQFLTAQACGILAVDFVHVDAAYNLLAFRTHFGTHTLDQDELGSVDQLDQPC